MDKPTKKNKNLNREVVNRLIEKYGVSRRFITMSIRGDRTSETSDKITKEYKRLCKKVVTTLKEE